MRTACSLPYTGVCLRDPLDRDLPPPGDRDLPPGQRPPCHVTCGACWDRDLTPCGQTDTCGHITLPQTSFAGGKKFSYKEHTLKTSSFF